MARPHLMTDSATSERMKGIRRHHTKPEFQLRKLLWRKGIRYRCNDTRLPGSPDLVNRRHRWAIFVHGCYWHGHSGCKRATIPKRNTTFWMNKIEANRKRDAAKVASLSELGLEVVTVWECEVERMSKLGMEEGPEEQITLLRRLLPLPRTLGR